MNPQQRAFWLQEISRLMHEAYQPEREALESPKEFDHALRDENVIIKRNLFKVGTPKLHIKKGITFSETLFRLIDERHLDDVELYQTLSISRSLFSKLRSQIDYQPEKETVLKFIIGLKLNLEEAIHLLSTAGYNFQMSSYRDLAIRYCIQHLIYDLMLIDELLINHQEPAMFSLLK